MAKTFDQTLSWFLSMQEIFKLDGKKIKIILLKDDDTNECTLVAPFFSETKGVYPFNFEYVYSLSNYYTAFYEPLANNNKELEYTVYDFARKFAKNNQHVIQIDLNPMDPESAIFKSMIKGFKSSGLYVETYFRFGNWYLNVNGRKFDDYFNSLPSRLKSTIKRKERKLKRLYDVEKVIITKRNDVRKAMDDYVTIYEKSWKQTEPHMKFIRNIVEKYSDRGMLRLGVVYVDGKPAAGQIWFVYNNEASIFKLAYDPEYRTYSVGSILTKELMKYVIDVDEVKIVDYLCGDDNYKKDWMSDRRERWGMRVYKKSNILNWPSISRSLIKKYLFTRSQEISDIS